MFHWTVISGMKLRIQYVGVVALRRGRTKKRAWERVLALAGGARGGQRDHRGSGADLCTIRCKAQSAATPRRWARDWSSMACAWPMNFAALDWTLSRRARDVAGAPSQMALQYSMRERTWDL